MEAIEHLKAAAAAARAAGHTLARSSAAVRNGALAAMADALRDGMRDILTANHADVAAYRSHAPRTQLSRSRRTSAPVATHETWQFRSTSVLLYFTLTCWLYGVAFFNNSQIINAPGADIVQEVWFLAWPAYAVTDGRSRSSTRRP